MQEVKTIAEWYWTSYNIVSWDKRLVTHSEFMKIIILGE